MDLPTFRTTFPDFADTIRWPDAQVQFWLDLASTIMDAYRWGPWYDLGQALYTAHNLAISAQEAKTGGAGTVIAPTASKGAGPLSVSYDIDAVTYRNAGAWNMTTYGIRYYELRQMIGSGGIQLGACASPGDIVGDWSELPTIGV
jgi:hypothetical protein